MATFTPDKLYLEPFEGDLTVRGWAGNYGLTTGRTGNAIQPSGTFSSIATRALDTDSTYIVGAAYKTATWPTGGDDIVFGFRRSGAYQVILAVTPTGSWRFYRGSTVLWTSATGIVDTAAWLYVELKAVIDPSSGSLELVVNGTSIHTFTGNTKGGADNLIDEIVLSPAGGSASGKLWDDFYVWGGSSAVYLGNIRIRQYAPNADGTYSQYTPNSGSTHYNRVSEKPTNDGDSTYVADSVSGHKDSYSYSAAGISGAIKAVQIHTVQKKDDIGTLQSEHLIRAGGTDYTGPAKTLTQTYAAYDDALIQNPNTATDWASGDFASAEFGTEIV